jgi:putative acyl-CoA dehydrogenase
MLLYVRLPESICCLSFGINCFFLYFAQWFTSAPMCDAFLTLAKLSPDQASAAAVAAPDSKVAPSCFLVPRWKPNGERNTGTTLLH